MTIDTDRHEDGAVDVVQAAEAASSATPAELERLYWAATRRTTFGLVRYRRDAIRIFGSVAARRPIAPRRHVGRRRRRRRDPGCGRPRRRRGRVPPRALARNE